MTLAMFHSLPAYFGGKRRLVREIFRDLPTPSEAPVLADAFLGGGSVSLYAKARGYRVISNDISMRSHIVGKALIENSSVTVTGEDVMRLFMANHSNIQFAELNLCPDVLTTNQSKFVDLALANAHAIPEPKSWLMLLLIVKYVLRMRPMGNFGAKTITRQMEAGDWSEINPAYVKDALAKRTHAFPGVVAKAIAHEINLGVFSNGHRNEAHCLDVFEFLSHVEADMVYFDPPYAGTLAYESALRPLDDLLRGESLPVERSKFSGSDALEFLDHMFESARHIPVWVLSYGNARIGLDELANKMRRHRPSVTARELHHAHCTGLASEESKAANREFILIGRAA